MRKRESIMKLLHIIPLLAAANLLASCSQKSTPPPTGATTNAPEFKLTNGSTVRIGAVMVDGTNVPMTNVQVR
jgi:hypothetical protein